MSVFVFSRFWGQCLPLLFQFPVLSSTPVFYVFNQCSHVTWVLPQSAFPPHLHLPHQPSPPSWVFPCFSVFLLISLTCFSASLHLRLVPSLVYFVFKSILLYSHCRVMCCTLWDTAVPGLFLISWWSAQLPRCASVFAVIILNLIQFPASPLMHLGPHYLLQGDNMWLFNLLLLLLWL